MIENSLTFRVRAQEQDDQFWTQVLDDNVECICELKIDVKPSIHERII